MRKKIQKNIKQAAKTFLSFDLRSPKIKKVFLVGFFIFCIFFTGLIFLISEQLESKKVIVRSEAPSLQEIKIAKMVNGYPISRMVPYIAKRDDKVASYLVAIAKKESNWGKFSPKKDGRECYNYWGYRGTYNQTESGYSCFRSPSQAVSVVGKRIEELISQNIDTPREMVVWKCGSDCSVFSQSSVNEWIDDVGFYFQKISASDNDS